LFERRWEVLTISPTCIPPYHTLLPFTTSSYFRVFFLDLSPSPPQKPNVCPFFLRVGFFFPTDRLLGPYYQLTFPPRQSLLPHSMFWFHITSPPTPLFFSTKCCPPPKPSLTLLTKFLKCCFPPFPSLGLPGYSPISFFFPVGIDPFGNPPTCLFDLSRSDDV